MFYKINVLQLGLTNLADTFLIHESVKWFYEIDLNDDKLKNFDVLILIAISLGRYFSPYGLP